MEMTAMRQSFGGADRGTPRRVAMSVRPELAEAIYNGIKCFEFRRCHVRIPVGSTVLLYEVRPVARLTGQFTVAEVIVGRAGDLIVLEPSSMRSEERRVGKECRSRRSASLLKN